GPDDRNFVASRRWQHRYRHAKRLALVVRDECLELADRDWRLLMHIGTDGEGDDAFPFAQAFLRAEPPAQLGQVACLAKLLRRRVDVTELEQAKRTRDVVVYRTRFLARRRWALDASGS